MSIRASNDIGLSVVARELHFSIIGLREYGG